MKKPNLLYIIEHCSTGGMPAYTLKQIEAFKDQYNISVVELKFFGEEFIVQRNKIKSLVPFYSLASKEYLLKYIMEDVKPDIIHIQENPIGIMSVNSCDMLFKSSRDYDIVATTHSSYTKPTDFKYVPDRIVAVNRWQQLQFQDLTDTQIWEYPIENKVPSEQEKSMAKFVLAMSTDRKHILNVGLFTPGKNQ